MVASLNTILLPRRASPSEIAQRRITDRDTGPRRKNTKRASEGVRIKTYAVNPCGNPRVPFFLSARSSSPALARSLTRARDIFHARAFVLFPTAVRSPLLPFSADLGRARARAFFFLSPRSSFVKRRESCKQLGCPPGNIPIKYVLSIVNRWSGVFHRRAVIQCGSINAKPLPWFIS